MGACSAGKNTQSHQIDGLMVSVETNPSPLQVGRNAEITASLTEEGGAELSGCQLRFRQYMPGMEMSADNTFFTMVEEGSGRYHAQGGEYTMGGDWKIEFVVNCSGSEHTAAFPYHLKWPE